MARLDTVSATQVVAGTVSLDIFRLRPAVPERVRTQVVDARRCDLLPVHASGYADRVPGGLREDGQPVPYCDAGVGPGQRHPDGQVRCQVRAAQDRRDGPRTCTPRRRLATQPPWSRSAARRYGLRRNGAPTQPSASSSPSSGSSGASPCATSISGRSGGPRASSRSAPTSSTRSRSGSADTNGPRRRPGPRASPSVNCPTGSPPPTTPPICRTSGQPAPAPLSCGSNAGCRACPSRWMRPT